MKFYTILIKRRDAGILTFESTHPKWSYAKINSKGLVTKVYEKSQYQIMLRLGFRYWSSGKNMCSVQKQ